MGVGVGKLGGYNSKPIRFHPHSGVA